jgi:chromosome segregation ATPase
MQKASGRIIFISCATIVLLGSVAANAQDATGVGGGTATPQPAAPTTAEQLESQVLGLSDAVSSALKELSMIADDLDAAKDQLKDAKQQFTMLAPSSPKYANRWMVIKGLLSMIRGQCSKTGQTSQKIINLRAQIDKLSSQMAKLAKEPGQSAADKKRLAASQKKLDQYVTMLLETDAPSRAISNTLNSLVDLDKSLMTDAVAAFTTLKKMRAALGLEPLDDALYPTLTGAPPPKPQSQPLTEGGGPPPASGVPPSD